MKPFLLVIAVTVAGSVALLTLFGRGKPFGHASELKIPKHLVLADYQTPEDARLTSWLCRIEQTEVARQLDAKCVKPMIDDLNTQKLAVEGAEALPTQFPDVDRAARICSQILHLPKPRVFICQQANVAICAQNYSDPVIVVTTDTVRRFSDPAELRFLIGRELAHVAAHHVALISLRNQVKPTVVSSGFLGKAAESMLERSLSKWTMECQFTADRAGLIASQDLPACERALVKLATGFDDAEMSSVNIANYITQCAPNPTQLGRMAGVNAISCEASSIPERIRGLRDFEKSPTYISLWK